MIVFRCKSPTIAQRSERLLEGACICSWHAYLQARCAIVAQHTLPLLLWAQWRVESTAQKECLERISVTSEQSPMINSRLESIVASLGTRCVPFNTVTCSTQTTYELRVELTGGCRRDKVVGTICPSFFLSSRLVHAAAVEESRSRCDMLQTQLSSVRAAINSAALTNHDMYRSECGRPAR
jgi:hypothetical protein